MMTMRPVSVGSVELAVPINSDTALGIATRHPAYGLCGARYGLEPNQ